MYLELAKQEAKKASKCGEVPVGAVIVFGGNVIARAFNKRESKQSATAHAEVLAINKACKKLKSWRLDNCCIYVTLLPCPMCAGAIIAARIKTVYAGAVSAELPLIEKILTESSQNHKTELVKCNDIECENMLKDFFKSKRA